MGNDRDRLVEDHLDLVRSIAAKVRRSLSHTLDMEDLVAYGSKGLVEAASRFDPSQGVSFSTFAHYRIRGAMFDGMRAMGWYSRSDSARYRAEVHANEYLRNLADRPAGQASEAADPAKTLEEIAEVLAGLATVHITSLEAAASATDERLPPPDRHLEQLHMQSRARQAVEKLPEQERRLMQLYYFEDRNLESVSVELGMSKSWASRLHARAVEHLRKLLDAEDDPQGKKHRTPRSKSSDKV
jgi:RNA polymerase sigma factor for flagellar operon FliA